MPYVPTPYLAPEDEFDMYGLELPLGTWGYNLDDHAVYGPGLYPLYDQVTRTEPVPGAHSFARHQVPTGSIVPAGSVRLAPDCAFMAWRNEAVLISPHGDLVEARLRLFVARRGMGATVRRATAVLDLNARTVTLPGALPEELCAQAAVKARRILALLDAARAERDAGLTTPEAILARPDTPEPGSAT